MRRPSPIRISRAGDLERADFEVLGTPVTVLTTRHGVIARAALAVRAEAGLLEPDEVASRAVEACGCGVLVTVGGDVSIAGPPPAGGWRVRVADGVEIALHSGGLATARADGAGTPWRSVTVTAPSCRLARETASAVLAGRRQLPDGVPARLVGPDGQVTYTRRWAAELVAA